MGYKWHKKYNLILFLFNALMSALLSGFGLYIIITNTPCNIHALLMAGITFLWATGNSIITFLFYIMDMLEKKDEVKQ